MSGPETEPHHSIWRLPTLSTEGEQQAEADYYLCHITSVKTVDDLIADDRLYRFVMTAFGLTDMISTPRFIARILSGGGSGTRAFDLEIADQRLHDLAEVFDFPRLGAKTTRQEEATHGVVLRHERMQLETEAALHDEGARLALSFERKIGRIRSIYGLLGDPDLYAVVQLVLGLPPQPPGALTEEQMSRIASELNLLDLQTAAGTSSFLARFSEQWRRRRRDDYRDSQAAPRPSPGNASSMMSGDLLLSVQAMRNGSL